MNAELLVVGGAFVTGLMGGGHCALMCGGIATGFSRTSGADGPVGGSAAGRTRGLIRALQPNLGRIAAYTLAGAVAGGLGHGIVSLARNEGLTLVPRAAVGLVLVIAGLRMLDRSGRLAFLALPGRMGYRWLQPLQRRVLPANTASRRVLAGAAWGFLPCGLSTTMLAAAWLQSSAAQGALTMFAFGLGTLPVMLALSWSGARLGHRLQQRGWRVAAGTMVLLAGLVTLSAPLLVRDPHLHAVLTALGCSSIAG
jgi:hypothetical protein